MSESYQYLRVVSAPVSTNHIATPAANNYSQQIDFTFSAANNVYNTQYFQQYTGNGNPTNYRFPISSNVIIKGLRLSIPNYPGARFAYDPNAATPLVRQGYKIGAAGFKQPPVAPINSASYNVQVNQLGEWTDLNIIVNAGDYQNGNNDAVFFYLSFGAIAATTQSIYVDFRNYQTAFQDINVYLLAELQVIAPAGIS